MTQQLGISPSIYQNCNWQGRSIKYYRKKIRELFGFREASINDAEELVNWLTEQALIYELKFEQLKLAAFAHLRELKIEPPTLNRLERITRSALHSFEDKFFQNTVAQLSSQTLSQIDKFFQVHTPESDSNEIVSEEIIESVELSVWNLKKLMIRLIYYFKWQKLLYSNQMELSKMLFFQL